MVESLLRRALPAVEVSSAGSLPGGRPASAGSVRAMAARGIDLSAHRSSTLDAGRVRAADLVIAMARQHLREVVVTVPSAFDRTFTLPELVRRGEAVGPAASFEAWLAAVGGDRRPADLLGEDPADDIADPIGGPDSGYERTAVVIEDLVGRLARLLTPVA